MRDNHLGLPEILDAYERGSRYFGVVRVVLDGEPMAFEMGVEVAGYRALRRVLETRPFDPLVKREHRYFFVPSMQEVPDSGDRGFKVRIEQGREGREFSFQGPKILVANLLWFFELRCPLDAAHLARVGP